MTARRGRQSWEFDVGDLSDHPPALREFALDDCSLQCELYKISGDATHLLRAWRCARAFGEVSTDFMVLLAPHLDAVLPTIAGKPTRANQLERRNFALLAYYREMTRAGAGANKASILRSVASRHGFTAGSLEQAVLKHEKRGQRGKRS